MHVLVVDCDETLRELVRETLTNTRGAKVIEAEDAGGGLRQLMAHPETTLIMCDWNLAGMSGAEFVERGRSMRSTGFLRLRSGQAARS
jgi:CheY-like chemotaxis protein